MWLDLVAVSMWETAAASLVRGAHTGSVERPRDGMPDVATCAGRRREGLRHKYCARA